MRRRVSALLLAVAAMDVSAEQFVRCKGYEIHYTTLSSMLIPSDIAEAHDIVRADDRIIANIAVRKQDETVRAEVEGVVKNLPARLSGLEFREITGQDAVYYLAIHVADKRETLEYELRIRPFGESDSCALEFTRTWN